MNSPTTTEETYHVSNILKHYAHAKEKHPYFCDRVAPVQLQKENLGTLADYRESVAWSLGNIREEIEYEKDKGELLWNTLLLCETWEIDDAIANGNTAHAVEECYDAIAVLLLTIDVLEGRQKLGKPETKGAK